MKRRKRKIAEILIPALVAADGEAPYLPRLLPLTLQVRPWDSEGTLNWWFGKDEQVIVGHV